jgi:chromosome segregation ATPase
MLTEEQVEKKENQIKANEKKIEELTKKHTKAKQNVDEASKKINSLNEEIDKLNKDIHSFNREMVEIVKEHKPLVNAVAQEKEELKKDAFEKKVQGFVDKSISFYDCLEARLKRKQEDYKATMNDYFTWVDPKEVIKSIKKDIEDNRGFSMAHVNLRSALGEFERTTRELCTIKAQGQKPNIHTAKQQMARLDNFLESAEVIHRWHKEKNEQ